MNFSKKSIISNSAADTQKLAETIGTILTGGETLWLFGVLGAGKTCFIQGLARGLDIKDDVVSPTFTLHGQYQGRLILNHIDCYRLDSAAATEAHLLGFDELWGDSNTVTAVEWPELLESARPDHMGLEITILPISSDQRAIELVPLDQQHQELLVSLDKSINYAGITD